MFMRQNDPSSPGSFGYFSRLVGELSSVLGNIAVIRRKIADQMVVLFELRNRIKFPNRVLDVNDQIEQQQFALYEIARKIGLRESTDLLVVDWERRLNERLADCRGIVNKGQYLERGMWDPDWPEWIADATIRLVDIQREIEVVKSSSNEVAERLGWNSESLGMW